jgi:hypothetical protein
MRPAQVKTKLYGTQMRPLEKNFNTARTCLLLGITGSLRASKGAQQMIGRRRVVCYCCQPPINNGLINLYLISADAPLD